ncbi:hypothetical protein GCM10010339_73420 [Streptomyces alanosinicus]|uniref:Uncharacterized protein n=1 Tax=Streptomyces alanosinicus TaxID=68171 RepID=A0A918YPM4_9ACTN|nr:hypothetical protein GCM10010339_73420 [Streptomyces alanosinicus]
MRTRHGDDYDDVSPTAEVWQAADGETSVSRYPLTYVPVGPLVSAALTAGAGGPPLLPLPVLTEHAGEGGAGRAAGTDVRAGRARAGATWGMSLPACRAVYGGLRNDAFA